MGKDSENIYPDSRFSIRL